MNQAPNDTRPTARLQSLGQSLWLDNITRDMLADGTLADMISSLSVTGLTSNPSIYHNALKASSSYDAAIAEKVGRSLTSEAIFLNWPAKTCARLPVCFALSTKPLGALTAGSRLRSRHCWPTTPQQLLNQQKHSMLRPAVTISL